MHKARTIKIMALSQHKTKESKQNLKSKTVLAKLKVLICVTKVVNRLWTQQKCKMTTITRESRSVYSAQSDTNWNAIHTVSSL
jgi:hypothetical protein